MNTSNRLFPPLTRAFLESLSHEQILRIFYKGLSGDRPLNFYPWTGKIPPVYGPRQEFPERIVCVALTGRPEPHWEKD